jgi:ketosteroid isomerase-like protein
LRSTVLPDRVGETYRGHEGVIRAAENRAAAYEWLRVELEQIVEVGELLGSVHRMKAKARYTSIEFDATFAYLWTFHDGKVVHFRGYAHPR